MPNKDATDKLCVAVTPSTPEVLRRDVLPFVIHALHGGAAPGTSTLAIADRVEVAGREREQSELRAFLHNHLTAAQGGSLYVSGCPGSGKTSCINAVLSDDEFRKSVRSRGGI